MREYECYVYIVASRSRTLYIGMTSRLQARIADHQNGVFEGFSKDYRCTRLVYFELCTGPTGAILREKQLKGWTRAKKIALIEKINPTWVDLSEAWGKPVESYRWTPGGVGQVERAVQPREEGGSPSASSGQTFDSAAFRSGERMKGVPLAMKQALSSFRAEFLYGSQMRGPTAIPLPGIRIELI